MARTAGIGSRDTPVAPAREPVASEPAPSRPGTAVVADLRESPAARAPTAPVARGTAGALAPPTGEAQAPVSPWFNPSVLRAALAAEPLTPNHQAIVREQLRLLIGKHGAFDRDSSMGLGRSNDYKVERLLPFNGAHLANGLIQMSPKAHAEALRFLNGARDRAAIAGIGSLVHEGLHGHSPVGARWGHLDEPSQRIDHLAVAAAAQAIVVREFNVAPEAITTNVPYGVNETIDVIARHAGLTRAAARNVLYDGALRYFGAGPLVHTGQQVEDRFMLAVQLAAGKAFDEPLRRHLGKLP